MSSSNATLVDFAYNDTSTFMEFRPYLQAQTYPLTVNSVNPTFIGGSYSLLYSPSDDTVVLSGPTGTVYFSRFGGTYTYNGYIFSVYTTVTVTGFSKGSNTGSIYDVFATQSYPITINNFTPVAVGSYNFVYNGINDSLMIFGTSGSYAFVKSGSSYTFNGASFSVGTILQTPVSLPVCFLGEAPVLTPFGYKRMDSLKVGDKVINEKGDSVKIHHVEINICPANKQTYPYVIEQGIFGATERVLISPDHRIQVNGKMVKAKHLNLPRENMNGLIRYYNIQLEGWSNMIVAGLEVESLAPIQRTVLTVEQLVNALHAKYGSKVTNKEITKKVLRTCRILENGLVEVPIIRNK